MSARRAYRMVGIFERAVAVRPRIALTAPDTELSE